MDITRAVKVKMMTSQAWEDLKETEVTIFDTQVTILNRFLLETAWTQILDPDLYLVQPCN